MNPMMMELLPLVHQGYCCFAAAPAHVAGSGQAEPRRCARRTGAVSRHRSIGRPFFAAFDGVPVPGLVAGKGRKMKSRIPCSPPAQRLRHVVL